jgi:hypothetical protein
MTKGISSRQQHEDRLRLRRKQRDEIASGLALGSKKPPKAVPVPTKPSRPPVGLPAHRYPTKRVSLGDRQAVAPLGRADK